MSFENFTKVPRSDSILYQYGSDKLSVFVSDSTYISDWYELQNLSEETLYVVFTFPDQLDVTDQVYNAVSNDIKESDLTGSILRQADEEMVVEFSLLSKEALASWSYNSENS